LAAELVPSSAEGAALFRFPEAAGVFAIAHYRSHGKTTWELYAGEAVSRWFGAFGGAISISRRRPRP
jgi:hypothetical protein